MVLLLLVSSKAEHTYDIFLPSYVPPDGPEVLLLEEFNDDAVWSRWFVSDNPKYQGSQRYRFENHYCQANGLWRRLSPLFPSKGIRDLL